MANTARDLLAAYSIIDEASLNDLPLGKGSWPSDIHIFGGDGAMERRTSANMTDPCPIVERSLLSSFRGGLFEEFSSVKGMKRRRNGSEV